MNEGIPATAQTRTGYFATAEVETVLSLLSVIDNPMQDIPMAAVLRSPMVGMTDDEMAWMIAAYKRYLQKKQDRGVYGAWKLWEEIYPQAVSDENPDEDEKKDPETEQIRIGQVEIPKATAKSIWKKLEYFAACTEELRQDSRYLPVHELLYQIYRKTGYYDYVSSMPAGETRKANLDMLAEKAAAYASTSYRGLFHFVRYIEKLKKYDTDFGEASLGDESNSVRIMSIHKSKGLEFPVVFLAGMGTVSYTHLGFKDYIESHYITAEEILDILCRKLPQWEPLKNSVILLDGYTGFTPVQYRLAELFMIHSREVICCVTADPREMLYKECTMQHLFYMGLHTVCRLRKMAEEHHIPVLKEVWCDNRPAWRFKESPQLDFL